MGGRWAESSSWAALLLFSSMVVLQAKQMWGLLSALSQSDIKKLLHKCVCMVLEGKLQQVDQEISFQTKEAQEGHYNVFQK